MDTVSMYAITPRIRARFPRRELLFPPVAASHNACSRQLRCVPFLVLACSRTLTRTSDSIIRFKQIERTRCDGPDLPRRRPIDKSRGRLSKISTLREKRASAEAMSCARSCDPRTRRQPRGACCSERLSSASTLNLVVACSQSLPTAQGPSVYAT